MAKRSKAVTSKIMSSIRSKNTKPEKILAQELWKNGLRYRKHYNIQGKPDFAFKRTKIAVFCDGDFWHGNNWKIRGLNSLDEELSKYSDFWVKKITRNIERDKNNNQYLKKNGWLVLRYWESDIKKHSSDIAKEIFEIYQNRKKTYFVI